MQPPQGKKRDKKSRGVEMPYKTPKKPQKIKNTKTSPPKGDSTGCINATDTL